MARARSRYLRLTPAAPSQADIAELRQLAGSCVRPRVKAMLDDYVRQLESLAGEHAKAQQMATVIREAKAESGASASSAAAPSPPQPAPAPPKAAEPPRPVKIAGASVPASASVTYVPIENFGWDQDGYGKEPNNVYIYLLSGFDGIGGCKEAVSCDFGSDWFDLKVIGFSGKNYRLVKRNLDKNIVPAESKALVKKNSIKICLRKVRVGQSSPASGRRVSLALVVFTRVTRAGEGRVRRGHVARPDGEARKGRREREGEGPERVDHGHDEAECATHPADA